MATNVNTTQITPPRVPIIDERTGAVSREWYRWFYNVYTITGEGLGVTPVINGGTGLSTIPTNGQLLIGNGTGYTLNTLATVSGISVTNDVGTITLDNTGVLSLSGGVTGLTPTTATTGAVTLGGILNIANGGTFSVANPTAGAIAYGDGSAYQFTAVGTAGQLLTSTGAATPTWSNIADIAVTSLSFGTTGLTPSTATKGAITVAGTLAVANGGTGLTSTPANGALDIGNGTGFTRTTLTAGSGVTISNSAGAISISATGTGGTITSVSGTTGRITSTGGTTPVIDLASGVATAGTTGSATLIPVVTIDTYGRVTSITTAANPQGTVTSVSGTSPVSVATGTTTPVISLASGYGDTQNPYASKTANFVLAAPNGSAGVPTFRAIVAADIPTLNQNTSGSAASLSATLAATSGGTGQSVYATGDLLYAYAPTVLSKLASVATGNALISGGVNVAPSYGKIGLTTHVSGTLPTANGGTNLTSFTSGGVTYASSTSALATGSDLYFNGTEQLIVGQNTTPSGFAQVSIWGTTTGRGTFLMGRPTAATTGVAGTLLAYNGADAICGMDFQSNGANNSGYIGTYTYNAGAFAQGPYLNTGGTSWTTASDSRLKTIDGPITSALDKISTLLGFIGTMKSDPTQTKRAFLLAQDVQQVLPEIVTTDANGYLGIQYEGMIPLIVNAINELQQQVKKLNGG